MRAPLNKTSNERWRVALEVEKTWNRRREDIEARISERRQTWKKLIESLDREISFDKSKRILDIGAEATSIFLVVHEGEKYAVDPLFDYLFDLHPFLKEIDEYKDVHFISGTLEEVTHDEHFDIIFCLAMLDHIGNLTATIGKIDELLERSGYLVVMVDCHADVLVRRLMNSFDVELYHPHHFTTGDIVRLFTNYELKQHRQIFDFYQGCPSSKQKEEMRIYRIDKFISRMWNLMRDWGKNRDVPFMIRFVLCYGLAYGVSLFRRKDKPIHPLKKPSLFVFQKR